MEYASNLLWLATTFGLLAAVLAGVCRGRLRVPAGGAIFLTVLLCVILLPAISLSDDLLMRQQAQLPLAAQSWRLAVEGSELVTDVLLAVALPLVWMILARFAPAPLAAEPVRVSRPVARWLTRSQRLRPPLAATL